jgi:hypothetical protein
MQQMSAKRINSIMIDAESRELVFQLLDDVGVIEAQFRSGEPKPAVGRTIFVPILRRWTAEGLFYRVQQLILPDRVKFDVYSSEISIAFCKNGYLEEWMEMVIFKGVGVSSARYDQQFIIDDQLIIPDSTKIDLTPAKRSLRTKQFSKQKVFYWKKQFYTKTDVIKMHANRLGGVHFDFPGDDERHIDEIKNSHGYEVDDSQIRMLLRDEVYRARTDPARRDRIYDATELVAIDSARTFATAIRKDAERFTSLLAL